MSQTPNLVDAAYLELALRARESGDLPAFVGAMASVSPDGLALLDALLARFFGQPAALPALEAR